MNSPRPYLRQQMQQQQAQHIHPHQFQQQFQPQNAYNNPHFQQGGQIGMAGYPNAPLHNMTTGVSPAPSLRIGNSSGMQASPATASTAPQHFSPSVCHQAQQQARLQQQPIYNNNCPVQQQHQQPTQAVIGNNGMRGVPQQTPGMPVCNGGQQGYGQQTNYIGQPTGQMNQALPAGSYNGNFNGNVPPCNNPAVIMNPNNGYVVNQCSHMAPANGNAAPGFNSPCSPCNGHHHHHHQQQVVCNPNPVNPTGHHWQPCYPTNNMPTAAGPQQQVPQAQMPYQQQQPWNGVAQPQVQQQQPMPYNGAMQTPLTQGGVNHYNGYSNNPSRLSQYNNNNNTQAPSLIQCQDVSQSQDFNRARAQENSQQLQQTTPAAPTATGTGNTAQAPGNMRPETYQRTLEYVQQCQTWATGPDNVKIASKENKPPQQPTEPVSKSAEQTSTVVVPAPGRALLSPGQDAVSSSTDRQEAAAALQPSTGSANQSNMVVTHMNTSLNSLMEETRFLQMIQ